MCNRKANNRDDLCPSKVIEQLFSFQGSHNSSFFNNYYIIYRVILNCFHKLRGVIVPIQSSNNYIGTSERRGHSEWQKRGK